MSVTIRDCRENEKEQLAELWVTTFAAGTVLPDPLRLFDRDDCIQVAEDSGRLVGGYMVRDLTMTRGDALLRCGGLSYMAVAPESRRQGIGVSLLTHAMDLLHHGGWHLTSGYASRESIYRKFGWECAGKRVRIECPNQRYPRLNGSMPIRRLSIHDWEDLQPVYSQFARGYSGMTLRQDLRFSRNLFPQIALGLPSTEPLILAAGDPIEAYAILPLSDKTWSEQEISELVWTTPEGYRSILSAATSFASNQSSLVWFEPSDGPFMSYGLDRGVKCSFEMPFGPRIINVTEALSALQPECSGSFRLFVRDEYISGNGGPWQVAYTEDGVQIERCEAADIEMEPGAFVQAFLGEPSFEELLKQGFVAVNNESATKQASGLFSPRSTYCLDFF